MHKSMEVFPVVIWWTWVVLGASVIKLVVIDLAMAELLEVK